MMKLALEATIGPIAKQLDLMIDRIQKSREARNTNDTLMATEVDSMVSAQGCLKMLLPKLTTVVTTIEEDEQQDEINKGEASEVLDLRSILRTLQVKHHRMAL
uniref:Uncharacterized protein n=1 Tax=Cannabis sativa TaxID=3483 RepID=A0A803QBI9_CANSA